MNILIIHGWGYSPEGHWQQWLLNELRTRGIKVALPMLPEYDNPTQDTWLTALSNEKIDGNTIVITHSLGCAALLRLLERDVKVHTAIFVAAWAYDIGIKEVASFFKTDFDWNTIKNNVKQVIVINSDTDPYLPLSAGEHIATKLGGTLLIEPKGGHINIKSGFGPYPRVLQLVLDCLGKTGL